MDTQISQKSSARQNSHPPEKTDVRGLPHERMVDQLDSDSRGSSSYCGADSSDMQRGRGCTDIQRRDEPEIEKGISGTGGIFVGGQFWVDGYFAETVGEANEEVVKKYIRQHRKNP